MIKVTFKPYELEIKGHANQNKKGKDIVCSAMSILFYTLCESLSDDNLFEEKPIIEMEDGNGSIKCVPKKEYEANVQLIFWTVLNGISLMAESYPQFIKFICGMPTD